MRTAGELWGADILMLIWVETTEQISEILKLASGVLPLAINPLH